MQTLQTLAPNAITDTKCRHPYLGQFWLQFFYTKQKKQDIVTVSGDFYSPSDTCKWWLSYTFLKSEEVNYQVLNDCQLSLLKSHILRTSTTKRPTIMHSLNWSHRQCIYKTCIAILYIKDFEDIDRANVLSVHESQFPLHSPVNAVNCTDYACTPHTQQLHHCMLLQLLGHPRPSLWQSCHCRRTIITQGSGTQKNK